MTLGLTIVIGLVFGLGTAYLANLIKRPASTVKTWVALVSGLVFGALGAVSADQLLTYGAQVAGISIVPAIVGSIVLAFVVLFAEKRWFGL